MASGPPSPSGKAYSRKSHGPNKAPSVPSFDAHNGPLLPTVSFTVPTTAASRRDLRRRLSAELAQVRAASKRLNSLHAPAPSSALSATDPSTPLPPHPPTSKHKSKKGGAAHPPMSAEARQKLYAPVFKTCGAVLSRLMKHKHGWVFNKPVDASALGLRGLVLAPLPVRRRVLALLHGLHRRAVRLQPVPRRGRPHAARPRHQPGRPALGSHRGRPPQRRAVRCRG